MAIMLFVFYSRNFDPIDPMTNCETRDKICHVESECHNSGFFIGVLVQMVKYLHPIVPIDYTLSLPSPLGVTICKTKVPHICLSLRPLVPLTIF